MTPFILIGNIICLLCVLLLFVFLRIANENLEEANERIAELETLLEEKFRDAKKADLNMERIKHYAKNIQRIIDHAEPNDTKPNESVWKSSVTRIKIIP